MSCAYELERRLLKFSTFSCFCFAALGIGCGLWASSLVIVFDGAYSLISLFLSMIALAATTYIHRPIENQDHFVSERKRSIIEAGVVLVKGVTITIVCIVSFLSALEAMFNGGREVNAGFALVFGIVNVVGCLGSYYMIKKNLSRCPSALLQAESSQWLMDTVISAAVLIGFFIALIMAAFEFSQYAVYADPMMVILASIYFVTVPIQMIKQSSLKLMNELKPKTVKIYPINLKIQEGGK